MHWIRQGKGARRLIVGKQYPGDHANETSHVITKKEYEATKRQRSALGDGGIKGLTVAKY